MGMIDGVSNLWIVRRRGALEVDGHKDEVSAIDALIRHALTFGPEGTKERIEAAVSSALKHLDDEFIEVTDQAAPEEAGKGL